MEKSKPAKENTKLRIAFGALCAPIKEQLKSQGINIRADFVKKQQRDADALAQLHISGVLPDSAVAKGRQTILKRIQKETLTATKRPKARKG